MLVPFTNLEQNQIDKNKLLSSPTFLTTKYVGFEELGFKPIHH